MKKTALLLFLLLFANIFAQIKVTVDRIIHNAKIYTVNENFDVAEAMAILNGKVVGVGKSIEIHAKFTSKNDIDLKGKTIYPGFIDAHAHFFGLGSSLQNANLRETKSWDEILNILKDFAKTHPDGWLLGRGWDQNDWAVKEFPTKEKLVDCDRLI